MNITQTLEIVVLPALVSTLEMLIISTILSILFGFFLSVVMVVTYQDGLHPNAPVYKVLDLVVNLIRSFPFIILMVAIIPFTRALVGTSIGLKGAIVPITIAATPFIARVIEAAMREVDPSLIEAAKSFGASDAQIVFRVMLVEALPSIVLGIILSIINILGASAMAGVVGAGGLGAVALIYGYQGFNKTIMYSTVLILILLVQLIQNIGNLAYKKLKQ